MLTPNRKFEIGDDKQKFHMKSKNLIPLYLHILHITIYKVQTRKFTFATEGRQPNIHRNMEELL